MQQYNFKGTDLANIVPNELLNYLDHYHYYLLVAFRKYR